MMGLILGIRIDGDESDFFWVGSDGWLVVNLSSYPADQVLAGTLMLFQAAGKRRCHVQRRESNPDD